MFDKSIIYNKLPYPFRVIAASMWGNYLRWWRYSAKTERLVQDALERDYWTPNQWKIYRENRLVRVLYHAARYVPYYKEQWSKRRIAGDHTSWEQIENWPILEKETVRKTPKAFVVDTARPQRLFHDHTSGSTGTPIPIWLSRDNIIQWYALFEARWRRWYGVDFQDRWAMLGGQMVVPYSNLQPPFWVWNAGLHQLYLSVLHIKPKNVPDYVKAICNHRATYIFGYSSALFYLAQEILIQGLKCPLKAAITNAEPLLPVQREIISQAFNCPVFETYGQAEIVAAAGNCLYQKLHIWQDASIVEVDAGDNDFLKKKGLGYLLGTSLINDTMPLVRYNTFDVAEPLIESNCPCNRNLPLIPKIYGRKDDVISTADGRKAMLLDIVFSPDMHLKQAQIIQESLDQFTLRIVPTSNWGSNDEDTLSKKMKERLGNVQINFEFVEFIEQDWNGKFRVIRSNLHQ